jgi:dihydropteroate synthase
MILEGAKILDFGAVSSRPNSNLVSESEEMKRVKSVIDILYKNNIYEQVELSIDSYTSSVIKYALDHGFQIVNDITGLRNNEIAKIVGQFNAKIIIMHMQGTPKTMQKNPIYNDVVKEIYLFFQTQIEKAKNFGINNIILDVGIGFGKTLKHNIELLQHLKTFQTLNYPLLVGVSRKSMIDKIISTPINERLAGTLTLHQKAIENGVSILRVHDVKEHRQMIEILKELHKI